MMQHGPIAQSPSLRDYKMASSGNNVYLVWSVQNSGQGMSLFFEQSRDGGKTFGSKTLIANVTRIDNPGIATYGNNVYVMWSEGEQQSKLMISRSTDGGTAFQHPISISTGNTTQFTIGGITSYGNNVNLVWTGLFGPNRNQSVMVSQSSDGGTTFGEPVLLSNASLQSNEQAVVQSNSTTYVVWNSRQNCPDPMGNCNSMLYLQSITDGELGTAVHLDSLDGIFPIEIVANSNTVLVEGLKRAFNDAVFENSTIIISQSHDKGKTFSTSSSTYPVYMAGTFPVLADSTLYQFWTVYELGLEPEPIYVERSLDGGKTFETPEEISGNTTPVAVQLDSQVIPYGNSVYVVWYGTDNAGAYHLYLDKITPDSHGNVRTIEDLYQAGGFRLLPGISGPYLLFGAGQNLFFEPVNDTGHAETSLFCPINHNPQPDSMSLDKPNLMIDGMPSQSILANWNVALSTEIHASLDESDKVIYQVQAIKDGKVTFKSQENYTVTCGYLPNDVIYWSPKAAGNYTVVASLLNPHNSSTITSSNQTVQVSENKYLDNFSSTMPVQFKIVNESSIINQGGWAKFTVKAGPSSPNYRLHDISLWIDAPQGVRAWFDKYSIFSYDYTLDNLTMYVYADSAAAPGVNSLKIEGKGVAANLLNGTIFNIGNPMPPAGPQPQLPLVLASERENGQQIGSLDVTISSSDKPSSSYAVIGKPNLHPVNLCSKEPMINGMGGGTSCLGFVGYEDFPVTVYSDVTQTVDLGATNLPNGTWVKFLPQQVAATPKGTQSRLVMAGALEPSEINVLSIKVGKIFTNTTQGSSVSYMPLDGDEKIHVLDAREPIEFGPVNVNINNTTPSPLGLVYDSTSGSLPVSLTVRGIQQNNTTVPVPSWLTVNFVPSLFTLNYSEPFYIKMETGTMAPPSGANVTVLVDEKIGERNYTGHIQISIPPAVYFGGNGGRLGPVVLGNGVNTVLPPTTSTVHHTSSDAKDRGCKTNFVSIANAGDGRLACVRPDTAQKLVERGWAMKENNKPAR